VENILERLAALSFVDLTLRGVKAVLLKELSIQAIIIMDDAATGELKRRNKEVSYPTSTLRVGTMASVRDGTNNKYVQKHGRRSQPVEATKATSVVFRTFPAVITLELEHKDNDARRILLLMEALCVVSAIGGVSFVMTISGEPYTIRIEVPDSNDVQLASLESADSPGAFVLTCPIVLHGFVGYYSDVAAVQSTTPVVSYTIGGAQV